MAEETQTFRSRARLFVMEPSGWAYRGSGDVKLLFVVASKRTRLVMTDAASKRVLLNHYVQSEAALRQAPSEQDDRARAFSFSAYDAAAAAATPGAAAGGKLTFALRFKAEVVAAEFERFYAEAADRNALLLSAPRSRAPASPSAPLPGAATVVPSAPSVFGVPSAPLAGISEAAGSSPQAEAGGASSPSRAGVSAAPAPQSRIPTPRVGGAGTSTPVRASPAGSLPPVPATGAVVPSPGHLGIGPSARAAAAAIDAAAAPPQELPDDVDAATDSTIASAPALPPAAALVLGVLVAAAAAAAIAVVLDARNTGDGLTAAARRLPARMRTAATAAAEYVRSAAAPAALVPTRRS